MSRVEVVDMAEPESLIEREARKFCKKDIIQYRVYFMGIRKLKELSATLEPTEETEDLLKYIDQLECDRFARPTLIVEILREIYRTRLREDEELVLDILDMLHSYSYNVESGYTQKELERYEVLKLEEGVEIVEPVRRSQRRQGE